MSKGEFEKDLKESDYKNVSLIKGIEATCVEIASEMKKCFWLKETPNFNVLWNFYPI